MVRHLFSCAMFLSVGAFGVSAHAEGETERIAPPEAGSSSPSAPGASVPSPVLEGRAPAETPPSPHALFGDFGLNFGTQIVSLTMFTGYRYAAFRVGPLVNAGVSWYNAIDFYGAGLGPVFELPNDFNVALVAAAGWQVYHVDRCDRTCTDAGLDEARLAFEGRLSLGRAFAIGRGSTRLIVSGAFSINYSSRRAVPVPSDAQPSDNFPSNGGYHPGGLLSVGFDTPL